MILLQKISLTDLSWAKCSEWFLETYFLAVENEISKGAARTWRRVDRSQKSELQSTFEALLSQNEKTCLWVAFQDETPVGYFLGLIKDCIAEIPRQMGYINGLYVIPSLRRHQIGSQLYAKGLQWFQERGIRHFELYTAIESEEATRFWSHHGFKVSEQVMNRG